jgi:hypothetical protein
MSHSDDWEYGRVYDVTTVRKPSMRKPARDRCIGLTDTVCTRADGTTYVIPRRKPAERTATRKPTVTRETSRDILLQARMGTIHAANDI